jgi:hypothetical protein
MNPNFESEENAPRPRRSPAVYAGLTLLAGATAYNLLSGESDSSSIHYDNIDIQRPTQGNVTLTAKVSVSDAIRVGNMIEQVEDDIATEDETNDNVPGYDATPGTYPYMVECYDKSNREANVVANMATIACSFVLWPENGEQPNNR